MVTHPSSGCPYARRVLGSHCHRALVEGALTRAAQAWHATSVDPAAVAGCLPRLRPNARIIGISADGGALLHHVLVEHPRAQAVLLDLASAHHPQLEESVIERVGVRWHGRAQLADWRAACFEKPDVVLVNDVLHHVPVQRRLAFLVALRSLVRDETVLIVKETARGGLRAAAGRVLDACLSRTRALHYLNPFELRTLVGCIFPDRVAYETPLFQLEAPHYCWVFAPASLDCAA